MTSASVIVSVIHSCITIKCMRGRTRAKFASREMKTMHMQHVSAFQLNGSSPYIEDGNKWTTLFSRFDSCVHSLIGGEEAKMIQVKVSLKRSLKWTLSLSLSPTHIEFTAAVHSQCMMSWGGRVFLTSLFGLLFKLVSRWIRDITFHSVSHLQTWYIDTFLCLPHSAL